MSWGGAAVTIIIEIKCTIHVMLLSHPQTTPLTPVCGKIVFQETSPWCQRLETTVLSNTGSNQKGWSQVLPPMSVASCAQTALHTHTYTHTRISPPSLHPSAYTTTPWGSVTVNLFSLSQMYRTLFSIHTSSTTFVTRNVAWKQGIHLPNMHLTNNFLWATPSSE